VTLVSDQPIAGDRQRNPFLVRDIFSLTVRRPARVWEFDAKDEAEVRRYYDEAKAEDLDQVRGFSLTNIEEVA
jgi:hypothetical protein